jgi:hypothetical protein
MDPSVSLVQQGSSSKGASTDYEHATACYVMGFIMLLFNRVYWTVVPQFYTNYRQYTDIVLETIKETGSLPELHRV